MTLQDDVTALQTDLGALTTLITGTVIPAMATQTQTIADLKTQLANAGVTDPAILASLEAMDASVKDVTTKTQAAVPAAAPAPTPTPTPTP